MLLTLAVVGPTHAFKGEVYLETRIDGPEGRLTPGTIVPTEPTHAGPLTVGHLRLDGLRWFAVSEQARDHTVTETSRGMRLLVETDDDQGDGGHGEGHGVSEEARYHHKLVDLRALSVSDEELGEITDIEPDVAQDRLAVTTPEGDDVTVPFVEVLVPAVDPEAGTVTLVPLGGLFPGHGQMEEIR